jgi:hypothetical protein
MGKLKPVGKEVRILGNAGANAALGGALTLKNWGAPVNTKGLK